MSIFAQRRQKCSEPPFEVPEFKEENAARILNDLVFRTLKKCCKEGFKSMEQIPTIKGALLKGHMTLTTGRRVCGAFVTAEGDEVLYFGVIQEKLALVVHVVKVLAGAGYRALALSVAPLQAHTPKDHAKGRAQAQSARHTSHILRVVS